MAGTKPVKSSDSRPGMADEGAAFRVTFPDRLTWLLDQFESRADASTAAGVTADQLAKYVRGGAKPALDTMHRLCEAQGVSLNWLAGGSGPRLLADVVAADDPRLILVPVYDIRASAGAGEMAESEEPIARVSFERDFLVAHGVNPRAAGLMLADGYSMQPTIDDGDPILVDFTDKEPRDKIYVFRRSGVLLIKELRRRSDGTLMLISHNASYPPEELPRDEADTLEIIGRVAMVLRSV